MGRNSPGDWDNQRWCGVFISETDLLYYTSLDIRENVKDLNANAVGFVFFSIYPYSLLRTKFPLNLSPLSPSGNKNLLELHSMWQELLKFYEDNHCLVNESEWPTDWSWNSPSALCMHFSENYSSWLCLRKECFLYGRRFCLILMTLLKYRNQSQRIWAMHSIETMQWVSSRYS